MFFGIIVIVHCECYIKL